VQLLLVVVEESQQTFEPDLDTAAAMILPGPAPPEMNCCFEVGLYTFWFGWFQKLKFNSNGCFIGFT